MKGRGTVIGGREYSHSSIVGVDAMMIIGGKRRFVRWSSSRRRTVG